VLSRIAESLFWIGRYVERADDTARILDVHLQMLLEDPYLSEAQACRALLAVMGAEVDDEDDEVDGDGGEAGAAAVDLAHAAADTDAAQAVDAVDVASAVDAAQAAAGNGAVPPSEVDRVVVLDRLAYDSTNSSSILGSLGAARENARRARETVSSELWECLNMTWIGLPDARDRATTAHQFFMWVRERSALVAGTADASMSRDDAWRFMTLGRSIERADMTARLVATSTIAGAGSSWTTLLRSCGAYESYVRTYRGLASDERAAEFLLLDRLFPRSVLHALAQAEECLEELAPSTERAGVSDQARRLLGRARTSLEYRSLGEVLSDLPAEMEKVQRACSAASDAVARRYFPRPVTTAWIGEVS
jgi:uncharacterized alpha-E superfamily protein